MRVLVLSRYGRLGASSRVRLFQYVPYLESKGWQVDVSPLFSDRYLQALYAGRPRTLSALVGYGKRLSALIRVRKYSLILIEKELFPFVPAYAEWLLNKLGLPYVVDYDDAIFHRYDLNDIRPIRSLLGCKIDAVMRNAAAVIVGNSYLAERAHSAKARHVETVPTVVDLARYNVAPVKDTNTLVVGWIGSPATTGYLSTIAPVIRSISKEFDVRFVAVGAKEEGVSGLPIEVRHWSEDTEVESVQGFDIGIMPLVDSPWERGKCGYKLIQFMACGLPVVASPVGINAHIIDSGKNGFLASSLPEWEHALRELLSNMEMRISMGVRGRQKVESWYSVQVQAPRLWSIMDNVVSSGDHCAR